MVTAINYYYERLTETFSLDNKPLLTAAVISFVIGYLQYVYAIRVSLREDRGPMPYWMHSFYLAHDSTWSYVPGSVAPQYGNHWFLRSTSTVISLGNSRDFLYLSRHHQGAGCKLQGILRPESGFASCAYVRCAHSTSHVQHYTPWNSTHGRGLSYALVLPHQCAHCGRPNT